MICTGGNKFSNFSTINVVVFRIFMICPFSILGIPYARPPVGKLRFKRTEPLLKINEKDGEAKSFYATSYGRRCFQPSGVYYPTYVGHEDCLTLNVFVPNTNQVISITVGCN